MKFFKLLPSITLLLIHSFSLPAYPQLLADTLFMWQGYTSQSVCGLRVFHNPADTVRRHTIVLKELAQNRGRSTVDDLHYIAEQIGRTYNIDPARSVWIINWGPFSYNADQKKGKMLFIRATFRRTSTGRLGSPQWKIVTKEQVERYTDRQFR